MLEHLGALAHAVVVQHLRGNRDGRDGCLELVRHVVDEVVLDLAQLLLPEGHGDGIQEHAQQQEGECQRGHQELHRREDVVALGGEPISTLFTHEPIAHSPDTRDWLLPQ